MAKKRKSDSAGLEEVDQTLYSAFCTAANSLSQLYSHSTNHQKLSFQAGELHALEKLYQWILKQQEQGSNVTNFDIIAYLQHELDYGTVEQHLAQQPQSIQIPYSELQHYHLAQGDVEACNGTKPVERDNRETGLPVLPNDSSMDMNS